MIVTPAQAGVQFKNAWIRACAGMTDGYDTPLLNRACSIIKIQHRAEFSSFGVIKDDILS